MCKINYVNLYCVKFSFVLCVKLINSPFISLVSNVEISTNILLNEMSAHAYILYYFLIQTTAEKGTSTMEFACRKRLLDPFAIALITLFVANLFAQVKGFGRRNWNDYQNDVSEKVSHPPLLVHVLGVYYS